MAADQKQFYTRNLVFAVILACLVCTSVASGAKCVPKTQAPVAADAAPIPPATEVTVPETTDAPTQQQTNTPEVPQQTQPTTPAASSVDGSNNSPPTPNTEGSTEQTPAQGLSGDAATFGDITSASGQCVVGNPNAYISTKYVDWVYDNRIAKGVPTFKNYIFDQIVTNNGSLNYCVRWDSTNKLSKTEASKFEAMLNRQFKAWNEWLIGYDCWPFKTIDVKIVGWAVRQASLLDWSDDSLGTIYDGVLADDGVPQCPDNCYKHLNQAVSSDTSACKGTPFDMSLWPTLGQGGGAGGDWGQRVDEGTMMASIDNEQLIMVAHEIGHGFGLPDFYEPSEKPGEDFPKCIMMAGSSPTVTPADGWMLRRVLEHIRDRYDF